MEGTELQLAAVAIGAMMIVGSGVGGACAANPPNCFLRSWNAQRIFF